MRIEVRHVTRIEGHAHLVVDEDRGEVTECRLEIVETPRFFEAILLGHHFRDVAPLVSRICGVCSNSHTLVSLAATEAALGVEVSEQTRDLRRLLACGEILQSHLLHLYFMAAPDYLGMDSIFPLDRRRRDLLTRALRMKKIGTDLCRVVGGRPVHPVTPRVGGFSALPEPSELRALRRRLVEVLPDLEATVDLVGGFDFPPLDRPAECLSLAADDGYPLMGDRIVSSAGPGVRVGDYRGLIEEYLVDHATAKFASTPRGPYRVGPLARIANGFAALTPMAARVAGALGLTPDTANPYRILVARLVEVVHWVEEAILLIDTLLIRGLRPEPLVKAGGGGRAVAAIEAPRGLLLHGYEYDGRGRVVWAECVIPTAQNLASIEADLRAAVPALQGRGRGEITRRLETLVRAYDPCVSCATHLLKVRFTGRGGTP